MDDVEAAPVSDRARHAPFVDVEIAFEHGYQGTRGFEMQVHDDVDVLSLPRNAVDRTGVRTPEVIRSAQLLETGR